MMKDKSNQASKQELTLYLLLGESVSSIQHLEDALSYSITIKQTNRNQKKEAETLLDKYRSYTLGQAIKYAKKSSLYPAPLLLKLDEILAERNWLIHRSIAQSRDDWDSNISRDKLIYRIKSVAIQAQKLQQLIEDDLIQYAEDNGVDMSQVRAEIKKHYSI